MRWSVHRWVVIGMVSVLVGCVAAWWAARDPLPRTIRIATAVEGGLYDTFGRVLAVELEQRTGREVALVPSAGSVENVERLAAGEVDLAILQATALRGTMHEVAVLAPLYPEVLQVIVRAESDLQRVQDLPGHAVSIGPPGSGMRLSALTLLRHYRIAPDELARNEAFFEELADDPELDAAIVTTGLDNPALRALLDGGEYRLLPVHDAQAISLIDPFFEPFEVPRGLFDERPPLPAEATPTIGSTCVLVARKDASEALVGAALGALYQRDLRTQFPLLVPRLEALASAPVPIHPAARDFLDPYGGLDVVANFIETLSGIKELLVGLFAFAYLLVDQLRRIDRKQKDRELQRMKDHLDEYLQRTLVIERAQMETRDVDELREYMREVTRIKIEALEELTEEDLRADRSFQIFLIQCANLSQKILGRISLLGRSA